MSEDEAPRYSDRDAFYLGEVVAHLKEAIPLFAPPPSYAAAVAFRIHYEAIVHLENALSLLLGELGVEDNEEIPEEEEEDSEEEDGEDVTQEDEAEPENAEEEADPDYGDSPEGSEESSSSDGEEDEEEDEHDEDGDAGADN